jgi:hypothetical protein
LAEGGVLIGIFLAWASYIGWIISTSFIFIFLFYAYSEYREEKKREQEYESHRMRQHREWLEELETNPVLRRIYEEPYEARYIQPVGTADVIELRNDEIRNGLRNGLRKVNRKVNWKKEGF